ncbi:hypothetical protein [Sorangium sp. So ce861]|uniref:hypothetical protein n=1 Tax=Sorangium sp. So ce861 TaxID=3133323 RepID=UPI003F643632
MFKQITNSIFALSLSGLTAVAVGCGPAAKLEADQPEEGLIEPMSDEEDLGEAEQALLNSRNIACGHEEGVPTWFFGKTLIDFTNQTANGTRIQLEYYSGPSARGSLEVAGRERVAHSYAGYTFWTHYLGWYDASGDYHACLDNVPPPPDAPTLIVQAR